MADKNVQMKVLNSSGAYDTINPASNASLIKCTDGTSVQQHIDNKNNPHEVTTAQIGAVPTSRTVNGHALSGNVTITKSDVGLGSVDNTADANKTVGKVSHALAISQGYGGQTGTYDGSAAKSISVPKVTISDAEPTDTLTDGELWGVYSTS